MTANIAEVKALKECKDANNNDYVNRFHTAQDVLPIANGVMATNLTVQDQTKQYEAADLLLASLKGQNKMNLGRLNGQEYNNQAFGVLVVEPDSTKVRLLYSPELGLHPLQGKSSIGEKLLWLQGEGSYQERPPLGIALKSQLTWILRRTPGIKKFLVKKLPMNMNIGQMKMFLTLDKIGGVLKKEVLAVREKKKEPLTLKEIFDSLEAFKNRDKDRTEPLFHHWLHQKE